MKKQVEENKKIAFVVTNGEDTVLSYGYGLNRKEAKAYLEKGLHHTWSVVEDVKVIKDFIEKAKVEDVEIPTHQSLLEQFNEYEEHLKELESYVSQMENNKPQLEVLKKALEMGAKINISFHGNESLDQTRENAETIAYGLGLEVQYSTNEDKEAVFERYMTDNFSSQINVCSFFTTYKKKEETA